MDDIVILFINMVLFPFQLVQFVEGAIPMSISNITYHGYQSYHMLVQFHHFEEFGIPSSQKSMVQSSFQNFLINLHVEGHTSLFSHPILNCLNNPFDFIKKYSMVSCCCFLCHHLCSTFLGFSFAPTMIIFPTFYMLE